MSGQNTGNSTSFIEAQQYSSFILENLHDGLLPGTFYRNVSDFGSGTTLNIKTIGSATVQDVSEDSPMVYNAIDTGSVTMSVTDYIGDAWYITDVLRQDGAQVEQLAAARAMEATRAIQERMETRFFEVANAAQSAGAANNVNGLSHRFLASGGNEQLAEADLIDMGHAFTKANVPYAGRVAFVDPVVAATLAKLTTLTSKLDRSPMFDQALTNGWADEHQFIMNIHGWNIFVSNRLPDIAAGTSIDGTDSITRAGKACIFMSALDDQTKPIMYADRQPVKVEGERNKDFQRDEFLTTSRFALGAQRVDTLGVIAVDGLLSA